MSEYKYTVVSNDGFSWGLFTTKSQAALMRDALISNYGQFSNFRIEEVK